MLFQDTISRYLARQYLNWLLGVLLVFAFLITVFDIVELLRRASGKDAVSMVVILQMAAFKLPLLIQDLSPFIILISSMLAFWRLAKANELVVARAAGLSPWQIVGPVISIVLLVGVLQITMLNPVGARLNAQFERIETEYFRREASQLALAPSGFWVRQSTAEGATVIHAKSVAGEQLEINEVMVLSLDNRERFLSRTDAESGVLGNGIWIFKNAWLTSPDGKRTFFDEWTIPTDMTLDRIRESFASADTISFWDLPGFIDTLRDAGFNAIEHRLRFHTLLSTPLLLCAMVLAAAIFSLRASQRLGAAYMVVGGISIGFVFFFINRIVNAIGLSAEIPVLLAAWIPAGVMTMLALSALLHLEDG